jgi:hypothetical protein
LSLPFWWREATEACRVWQRRFYDFVLFSESKRIEKLRTMAGWPTCPRVAFLTRRNPERLHHKNSGRLAAARYFLIAHR